MSDPATVSNLPQQRPVGPPEETRRDTDLPPQAPWWMRWLVANFREGWKWLSVQWPVAVGVLIELYQTFPDEVKAVIPSAWMPHLAAAAFLATAALRFVNQSKEQS